MNPRSILRTTISTSVGLARLPLDVANRLLGRRGLEVDAADATLHRVAGQVLGDDRLRAVGDQRREATRNRADAERLRAAADTVANQADEAAQARKQQAAAQRTQSAETAKTRKANAAKQAQERKRTAADTARKRKGVAEKAAAQRREATSAAAKRTRLAVLDDTAEALREREDALVAEQEADRLKTAAGNVKAARKGS